MIRDPYRLFFPVGAVLAILGTSFWVFYSLGFIRFYPLTQHSDLMVGGFLFSFVVGFLTTAVPRFTGSFPLSRIEAACLLSIFSFEIFFAFGPSRLGFHVVLTLGILTMAIFFIRRIRAAKQALPPPFPVIGIGVTVGFLGILGVTMGDLGWLTGPAWLQLSRLLYLQGMILVLVLGVGGRLVTRLLGWEELDRQNWVYAGTGFLLLSFPMEVWSGSVWGLGVRAAAVGWVAFGVWRIYRFPRVKTRLAYLVWLSAWCIFLGLLLGAIFPVQKTSFLHVSFISGLGLLTLGVATRVSLAHGRDPAGKKLESESKTLVILGIGAMLATVVRVSFQWSHGDRLFLLVGALCWILSLVAWWVNFSKSWEIFSTYKNAFFKSSQ